MVRRFKKILLVARGREEEKAAVERAVRLAKRNHAHLTALRVLRSLPREMRILGAAIPPTQLENLAVEEATEDLGRLLALARRRGVRVQTKVRWGSPIVEVIREVTLHRHDVVILNASSKTGLRARLFGNLTMRLLRDCPCPVWVVKSSQRKAFARVLAAVDVASDWEEDHKLNTKIMDLATFLAELEGSELHVAHAWSLFGEQVLRGRGGVPRQEINRMARQMRSERQRSLEKLIQPCRDAGFEPKLHLLKGSPESVIPQAVRRLRIEVLVMGTLSRTGISGLIMGNTAERILSRVDCSLLALKPDGFVTSLSV